MLWGPNNVHENRAFIHWLQVQKVGHRVELVTLGLPFGDSIYSSESIFWSFVRLPVRIVEWYHTDLSTALPPTYLPTYLVGRYVGRWVFWRTLRRCSAGKRFTAPCRATSSCVCEWRQRCRRVDPRYYWVLTACSTENEWLYSTESHLKSYLETRRNGRH